MRGGGGSTMLLCKELLSYDARLPSTVYVRSDEVFYFHF
jgi:hypothetical protein